MKRFQSLFFLICFCALTASAPATLTQARQALDSGDYYEALRLALAQVPNDPVTAYTIRAEAYIALEDNEQAIGQYQRALSHRPADTNILLEISKLYEQHNKREDAILYYEAAYDTDPTNSEVALKLMDLLGSTDQVLREIRHGEKALEHVKDDEEAYLRIITRLGYLSFGEKQRQDDAKKYLQESVQKGDPTTETLYLLARSYYRDDELQLVITTLDKALMKSANDPDIILLRGQTHQRMGKTEEAYEDYWRLNELKSPLWNELPEKVRLQTAQHKKQVSQIIVQQYGPLIPLLVVLGILIVLLTVVIIVFMRNKATDDDDS
jgi:tetratricopeptide (TPR) repeat protein